MQQFAQRLRVHKLQYIAELERLKVLESQLSLSLSSIEAMIRKLGSEQEVLERDRKILSNMHQQQFYLHKQPPPCPSSIQRRNNSRDLDSHFANLSSDGGQSK
ncbi:hypothetical protein QQ045_005378 [Rhodiola kirilowii]